MKRKICGVLAFVTLIACGCSNEGGECQPPYGANLLTVGLEQTRTILGEPIDGKCSLYWSAGDCIVADGVTSSEAQFEGEKSSVAVFDFGDVALDYPCDILYPASHYKDATTITLPSVQPAAVNGTIATNTLPMATCVAGEGEVPKLHHLAGIIHLQLRGCKETDNNNVRLVQFWGGSEEPEKSAILHEQVSGDFTIDYATATLAPTSDKVSAHKVSVLVTGELSTEVATDVFVVVPAQEYKDGFTVRIINEAGHYLDKTKPSSQSVAKGEIVKMPEIQFIPTGTMLDIEIPSGR